MAGFFGLEWTHNATLALILEQNGFNNSLAGYFQCNNSNSYQATGGSNASVVWEKIYLADAAKRLTAASGGYNWTIADVYVCTPLVPMLISLSRPSEHCCGFTDIQFRAECTNNVSI